MAHYLIWTTAPAFQEVILGKWDLYFRGILSYVSLKHSHLNLKHNASPHSSQLKLKQEKNVVSLMSPQRKKQNFKRQREREREREREQESNNKVSCRFRKETWHYLAF